MSTQQAQQNQPTPAIPAAVNKEGETVPFFNTTAGKVTMVVGTAAVVAGLTYMMCRRSDVEAGDVASIVSGAVGGAVKHGLVPLSAAAGKIVESYG